MLDVRDLDRYSSTPEALRRQRKIWLWTIFLFIGAWVVLGLGLEYMSGRAREQALTSMASLSRFVRAGDFDGAVRRGLITRSIGNELRRSFSGVRHPGITRYHVELCQLGGLPCIVRASVSGGGPDLDLSFYRGVCLRLSAGVGRRRR
jgi:hypothetical protein